MTPMEIKERAFYIFLMEGGSDNEIAKRIRSEFNSKTTHKSISAWRTKKDVAGLTWDDRKNALATRVQNKVEAVAENRMVEMRNRVRSISDSLYEQLIANSAPKITNFENAVYAFKTLAEYETKLERTDQGLGVFQIVDIVVTALSASERIRKALEQDWGSVSPVLNAKLVEGKTVER